MPRGKSPAGENKADRWKRLAEARTKKALMALVTLGKLANPNNYQYTSEQVGKIFTALQKSLDETRARFEKPARKEEMEFRL